ncbi:MAG: L-ribulose-5-phosphate 3-epimerase [Trueperaceae bacterium]
MQPVRLGVYEKALPSTLDWPERLALARRLGFDYLELSIDESDARLARLDPASPERAAIRAAVAATGVPIFSLCLSAHRRHALGSADPSTRTRAHEIFEAAIDLAVELGVRLIQVAGYFVYYEDETPESRDRYVEGLARGAAAAARAGVMLGIENMDTVGIASLREGLDVLERVGSPWLQLYPDVGNLIERGHDPRAELESARGRMVALHAKDARPGEPRRVPFGEGGVPFADAFARLAAAGYAGPVMVEMWNDDAPDSVQQLAAARAWVVARMREGGLAVEEVTP